MSRDLELEQKIDAYIKGQLSEEESQELWEDLLQQPEYIDLLETELGVKSIVADRAKAENPSQESSANENGIIYSLKESWKWTAAAAAVAVLIVAINFLQVDTNQTIQELAIGNINISKNLSSAPVMRAQKGNTAPSDSLLNRGFKAAISGDLKKAIAEYDKIIRSYPNEPAAVQAYLNKGIILYNSGDYVNAITALEQVTKKVKDKPVTKEKGYWYLGNAYMNLNKLEKAREAIHTTYAMDGIYRDSAFRILRKLDHKLGNVDFDNFEQQIKDN
ncbi:Tetratricopeptide repeat-containing protein [Fodinibius salinus]|uniref:Tetratricopeptide repeat-containing protein n=1 Tax=Fodinibius salinus TaxID=860790 RepID=A0A5D3YL65_9BACT|nr:tetratricopeptide repeat protein [Fodinibius salinus]TYP93696.1 Tetratricopeptide repeat-containing protein [Fodinibius salinus]